MTQEPDKPTPEPLERLLRRWGAERAAAEEPVGPLRADRADRAPGRGRPTSWAWLSLAAAACGLVVASVSVTMLAVGGPRFAAEHGAAPSAAYAPPAPATQPDAPPPDRLAAAVAELAESQQRLLDRAARLTDELNGLRDALAGREQARQAEQAAHAAARAEVEHRLTERLAALSGELARGEAQRAELARSLESAVRTVEQLRRSGESAAVAQAARLAELERTHAALARRQAAMLEAMRRVYLAADAPPDTLAARQQVIRRDRLIIRCADIRPIVRAPETRALLDTLEVWLTRVDLADPDSPDDIASVKSLLDAGAIVGRIEGVLAAGGEPPAVNAWLLQCQLLLMGLDRVG